MEIAEVHADVARIFEVHYTPFTLNNTEDINMSTTINMDAHYTCSIKGVS